MTMPPEDSRIDRRLVPGATASHEAGELLSEHPQGWRGKALPALKILLAAIGIAILIALALLRTWPPLNVVMTGSMEPAIETGDVVVMKRLDRPAEVGDIVAVHPPQEIQRRLQYPDTVIHRIVRIAPGGKVYTKGDARKQRDPFTVQRDRIDTRVFTAIPGAGRIMAFFASPLGLIWLGLGVLLFVLLPRMERQRDLEEVELDSLTGMRFELQQLAQHVEGDHPDAGLAPPAGESVPVQADTGELESELDEMRSTMGELVGAVGEYGEHLRSHTAVLQGMSAASQDLAATVAALRAVLPTTGAPAPAPPAPRPAGTPATPPAPQPAAASPPSAPTPPAPERPPWSATDQARREAERFIRWQEQRAAEIATAMGFHDPLAAARRAPLDDAADDEGIERSLWELAFENPDLLGG